MSKQNAKATTSNSKGPQKVPNRATASTSGSTTTTSQKGKNPIVGKTSASKGITSQGQAKIRAETKSVSQQTKSGSRISGPQSRVIPTHAVSATPAKSVRTGNVSGKRQVVKVIPLQYVGTIQVPKGYRDPVSMVSTELANRKMAAAFRKAYLTPIPHPQSENDEETTTTITMEHDPRIPTGKPSHALSLAKAGGGYASQIQSRLRNKSPWYTSIQDPLHGADCKIPDATGEETGVLQIVQRISVAGNDSGVAGMRVLTPYINSLVTTDGNGINYQFINTASTAIGITWGNGTIDGYNHGYQFTGADDLKAISNAHRVVSACMIVEHEASAMENQGEITMWCSPFSDTNSPLYNTYLNLYSSVTVPLNINKPATIRWFPLSRETMGINSFDPRIVSYCDFLDTSTEDPVFWEFGFLADGLATGVNFKVTIVVNYEFLPLFNTLNVLSVSPSPIDEEEESLVTGWVETMPAASIMSESRANSSPGTVSPQHGDEPTGFGMIANVVKEIIPFLALL